MPYLMGLVKNAYMAVLLVAFGVFLIGWRLRHASARLYQTIMAGSIVILIAFAIGYV